MKKRNYFNAKDQKLFVLHFSGKAYDQFGFKIAEVNKDRELNVSDKISIISTMTQDYLENSTLANQLSINNIKLHNSNDALTAKDWNNVNKIKYILDILDSLNTEYALILDGRDTVLVNDLDETFIERFKEFNKDIVFNATYLPYPKVVVEPREFVNSIESEFKYLNAGVCFGRVETLKEFYSHCYKLKDNFEDNFSEQLVVRTAYMDFLDKVTVDYNREIFLNYHPVDSIMLRISEDEISKNFKIIPLIEY